MKAKPIYTEENCSICYKLYWCLTLFWRTRPIPAAVWLDELKRRIEADGIRILERMEKPPKIEEVLVSAKPSLSPADLIRLMKGRIQYAVRSLAPKAFERSYAIRSVGEAKRVQVEQYVASQISHHPTADLRLQVALAEYQIHDPFVRLGALRESSHGRFTNDLHLAFVRAGRFREIRRGELAREKMTVIATARKKGHLLSRGAIMPDHIHLVLGCGQNEAPLSVALAYLNNLSHVAGRPVFNFGFYVGTFGEFDLGAVRKAYRAKSKDR